MSRQLEKTYVPKLVEERWHRFWIDKGYWHTTADRPGVPYCIVIPPPNVTGSLHIGHALNNCLQDILVRWRRMQGRNTLWMPGTDHAGIATQNVVEKHLLNEGTSRETLGREAFVGRVWEWKARYGGMIVDQLKRLGASCDWDRQRFTLDEGLSKAVREVFVRLYEEGLIYRGERLINWCPRCLTALSDIEVEHEEQRGTLYHIAYPVVDVPGTTLTVATTRPETMLGDTAVAVHPEDDRYRQLIGRHVHVPLTTRTIPIVGDAILVDREFGTGAVKITPAHDFHDFEAGIRHTLPRLPLFDMHGRLDSGGMGSAGVDHSLAKAIEGLAVAKARPIVERRLRDAGHLTHVEDHHMAIGKCYRCKTLVEPFLSPQWFVNVQPLAEPAIQAVEQGRVRLVPEGWVNNYLGWMRGIKDWCISRQIWWGHQLPAWYCLQCNSSLLHQTPQGRWIIPHDAQPHVSRTDLTRCPTCGGELIRDPDVLDTWFSSALWPFSTLGWPEETPELKTFYPTSTLVTGLDILFFWVARMIMMGLKFMGEVPFRDVYIHALVRDAEGQKMSKSKGNVIDPLQIMDEYGTDALRFTLAAMASPGRDVKLAQERIEGYRNFANKIWNAARFSLMHLDGPREALQPGMRSFADHWILSRLNETIAAVNASLEEYRFDQASTYLYQFVWHEFCDWYLELVKPVLQADSPEARSTRQTVLDALDTTLRLLHPFMPFLTEEIWQTLPHNGESIVTQPYPEAASEWNDKDIEAQFALLARLVTIVRTGRALLSVPPGKVVTAYGMSQEVDELHTISRLRGHAEHLARSTLHVAPLEAWPTSMVLKLATEGLTVGLLVEGDVDLNTALQRTSKQQQEAEKEASRLESKLANPNFTAKAPPEVVAEHEQRLKLLHRDLAILSSSAQQLKAMLR